MRTGLATGVPCFRVYVTWFNPPSPSPRAEIESVRNQGAGGCRILPVSCHDLGHLRMRMKDPALTRYGVGLSLGDSTAHLFDSRASAALQDAIAMSEG